MDVWMCGLNMGGEEGKRGRDREVGGKGGE